MALLAIRIAARRANSTFPKSTKELAKQKAFDLPWNERLEHSRGLAHSSTIAGVAQSLNHELSDDLHTDCANLDSEVEGNFENCF